MLPISSGLEKTTPWTTLVPLCPSIAKYRVFPLKREHPTWNWRLHPARRKESGTESNLGSRYQLASQTMQLSCNQFGPGNKGTTLPPTNMAPEGGYLDQLPPGQIPCQAPCSWMRGDLLGPRPKSQKWRPKNKKKSN